MFLSKSKFLKSHSRQEKNAYRAYSERLNITLNTQKRNKTSAEILKHFPVIHSIAISGKGSIADLYHYAWKQAQSNKKWIEKNFIPEEYLAIFEKESIVEVFKNHTDLGNSQIYIDEIRKDAKNFVEASWNKYSPKNIDEAGDIIGRITNPLGYLHRYFVMMEVQLKYNEVFGVE